MHIEYASLRRYRQTYILSKTGGNILVLQLNVMDVFNEFISSTKISRKTQWCDCFKSGPEKNLSVFLLSVFYDKSVWPSDQSSLSNITNITSKLCVPVSPQRGYLNLTFKCPNACYWKMIPPPCPPLFPYWAYTSVNSWLVTTCCCAVACPSLGAFICALLAFPGLPQPVEKVEITPCWRTVTLVLRWKELRS